jgi:glycosyltransferase involved in cell wall biosynthesis
MPSVRETFGLVYIEALSQGLPIIYSKGEAVDGYFDEATVGKKVNPESVSDIARAIASVRENYTAYIQGCTQEADKFSWKRIAERYISIYDEVAK